jgi:hypothetical protein
MKEQLEQYVKLVKKWYQDCQGSESATKASLIAPLFAILSYDMADPRECKPEHRMDFGKGEKAATPVDWAFLIDGTFAFFVEAKEVGAKITKYAEQLGMYFAKEPAVKLGILTNGVEWKFFTDLDHLNVMDKEPFLTWNVLEDELVPLDFLTLLQKSGFKPQLIRTFAQGKRRRSLLVDELTRLLEPSPEFVKLAIETLEIRKQTPKVIEEWTPILANAIEEWVRRRALDLALGRTTDGTNAGDIKTDRGTSPPVGHGSTLGNLIAAGRLSPPLKLFRKYKGTRLEATLRTDGAVEFQGQRYDTCSAAAEVARATVSGQRMNTNGWTFWQYQAPGGKTLSLSDARRQLARSRSKFIGGEDEARAITKSIKHGLHRGKKEPKKVERHYLRKRFWEALLSRPKIKTTRHANIAPGEYQYIGAGSGVRGLLFTYFIRQDEGTAELYIDRGAGQAAENKGIFDRLHKHKDEIESAFGGELSWKRLNDKQACRITYISTAGGYKSDEAKWPAIQDAMIEAMGRLEQALAPHLAKLKTELAAEGA